MYRYSSALARAFGDILYWVHLLRYHLGEAIGLFSQWLERKKEEGYHFLYHIQTPLKSNNIARMV